MSRSAYVAFGNVWQILKCFFLEEKLSGTLGAVDFVRAEFAIFD